jgi:hypothetical protein
LELKHFARHVMTDAVLRQEEIEGWRGEIHDGEIVRSHEDAVQEGQQGGREAPEQGEDERVEQHGQASARTRATRTWATRPSPSRRARGDDRALVRRLGGTG